MLTRIESVLSAQELTRLGSLLDQASWIDGRHSAGSRAAAAKNNEEMDQQCSSWQKINQLVASRLYNNPEFQSAALPSRVSAAFVSRYGVGMGYAQHVDDPLMGTISARYRSDLAITVFLSAPDSYQGGTLIVHTNFGPVEVKLAAGSAVVYPASSLHEVSTVTAGERVACVLWAQSHIRDPAQREVLADLNDARQALQRSTPQAQVTAVIDRTYMNLVRMWSDN